MSIHSKILHLVCTFKDIALILTGLWSRNTKPSTPTPTPLFLAPPTPTPRLRLRLHSPDLFTYFLSSIIILGTLFINLLSIYDHSTQIHQEISVIMNKTMSNRNFYKNIYVCTFKDIVLIHLAYAH